LSADWYAYSLIGCGMKKAGAVVGWKTVAVGLNSVKVAFITGLGAKKLSRSA